jgi:hypothetical protein
MATEQKSHYYGWLAAGYFAFHSGMIEILFPYSENAVCWERWETQPKHLEGCILA